MAIGRPSETTVHLRRASLARIYWILYRLGPDDPGLVELREELSPEGVPQPETEIADEDLRFPLANVYGAPKTA